MTIESVFGCTQDNLPDFRSSKMIALDIETRDPNLSKLGAGVRTDGYIVGVSLCGFPSMVSCYAPVGHERGVNFDKHTVFSWLKQQLETPEIPKVGANLVYDLDYLAQAGIRVSGKKRDIQIAEPLLDENRFKYNLEALAQQYLGVGKAEEEMDAWVKENLGKRAKTKENIWQVPSELVAKYARMDVELPIQIYNKQRRVLFKQDLWELFELESSLMDMLLAMKRQGVHINEDQATEIQKRLDESISEGSSALRSLTKSEVNVNNKENTLAEACDKLSIEYGKTKTGKPSFTQKWMEAQTHSGSENAKKLFTLVLALRKYEKFKGTFIEGAILKHSVKGRIHCQFNQLKSDEYGTVSGRFSSSSPNLQQVPSRGGDLSKEIRGLFVPDPGHVWWKFDYKAIEPRVAIHYAAEHNLPGSDYAVQFLNDNPYADVYQPMMDKLPNLSRSIIKMVYLGISYSMGAAKLAKAIEVEEDEAREIIQEFNLGVPYIRNLANTYTNIASGFGEIKTLLGRKRRFDTWTQKGMKYRKDFKSDGAFERYKEKMKPLPREEAEKKWDKNNIERAFTYKAFNSLIQGSSADIMKKAMFDIWQSGICEEVGPPLLTVHDELDFSLPDTPRGGEIASEIKRIMESTVSLRVPLCVDAERGPNWGSVE